MTVLSERLRSKKIAKGTIFLFGSWIVLPETAKEKPQKGTVLAIGPGDRDEDGNRIKMDVEVGDVVLFAKYSGTEIKYDGKKLLIMRESDILAIL